MDNPERLQNCQSWWVGACPGQYGMIPSMFEAHEEEKEHVVSALLKNGYRKATVCLPFVHGVSEPLKRVLK